MARNRLGVAVFIIGAAACAWWAFASVRPLFAFVGAGSVGVGEISYSPFDIYTLEAIGAPLVAFILAVLVRKRGRFARLLCWAHIIATVTVVLVMVLVIGSGTVIPRGVVGLEPALFIAAVIGVALWVPLQGFFASAFLGLLIQRPS